MSLNVGEHTFSLDSSCSFSALMQPFEPLSFLKHIPYESHLVQLLSTFIRHDNFTQLKYFLCLATRNASDS
jgi:hypothetical protein